MQNLPGLSAWRRLKAAPYCQELTELDLVRRGGSSRPPLLTYMRVPVLVTSLLIFGLGAAHGQMNGGEITGLLQDPSGAFVNRASVTATQVATQQSYTVTTTGAGRYSFPQLPIGEYDLAVTAGGFAKVLQHGLVLHSGDHLRHDISLTVGGNSQTVVVHAGSGAVQMESAEIKDVIDNQRVTALPLKTRQLLDLTLLSPGIVNPPGGTRGDSLQQTGKLINVLGNRTGHNLFLVDGVSVTDEYYNNVALSPSPDSTAEFNIELTDYSAEFGGKSGGMINEVTKSGGNQFHGSLYYFGRSSYFDARNHFAPVGVPTPLRGNQFGAAVGGPVYKGKTFFFASYDGQRLRQAQTQVFSVPTAAERAGQLAGLSTVVDPITKVAVLNNDLNNDANFSKTNTATAAAIALLNLLPAPTGAGNANNLQSVGQQKLYSDIYNARLDHEISAADRAYVRASYFSPTESDPFGSSVLNEALLPGFGRILRTPTVSVSAGETHTFSSSLVNEARFGMLVVSGGQKDPNAGNRFATTYGLLGTTGTVADMGYPYVSLSGLFTTVGTATGFNTRLDRNFEVFDNVTYRKGNHELTFGAYYFHLAFNPAYPNNARGTYTFSGTYSGNALADFLYGYPSQGQVGIGEGAENTHTDWTHVYVQDGWRLTPRLKVNVGLRYEYNSNLVAKSNQTSDVDLSTGAARFVVAGNPAALTGNAQVLTAYAAAQSPSIPVVSNTVAGWDGSLLTPRPLRLSPRIGLAWQVPGTPQTVVRAGFGVFTNQAAYSVLQNLAENIPFFLNKTVNNTTGTPTYSTTNILPANPNGAIGANSVNHAFKIEYNEVWNVAVEQAMSANSTFTLKYVGSRTVHADSSTAVNVPVPGAGAVQARRPFPNLNSFTTIRWDGWASFHGLTAQVKTRGFHGLAMDASYTWSHSIDDASDAGATNAELNLPQNIYAHNLSVEKASSSFDHRNRAVGNLVYAIPAAGGSNKLVHALTNKWQVGSILIAQSGAPFTVNLSTASDPANIGTVNGNNLERPNLSATPNNGPKTAAKWFNTAVFTTPAAYTFGNDPRNSVVGPGLVSFDGNVQREIPLHESVNLQLRAEVYNLINHPNYNLPGRTFGASNFGVISSALDPRQMQFAAKLTF